MTRPFSFKMIPVDVPKLAHEGELWGGNLEVKFWSVSLSYHCCSARHIGLYWALI